MRSQHPELAELEKESGSPVSPPALPPPLLSVVARQMGYYCRNYLHAYQPRTMLTASVYGTLGCVYPIALGAKVGAPERPVVAVCGDGGFAYNIQELATAKQHSIGAIAIVFNDNAFGNVRTPLLLGRFLQSSFIARSF